MDSNPSIVFKIYDEVKENMAWKLARTCKSIQRSMKCSPSAQNPRGRYESCDDKFNMYRGKLVRMHRRSKILNDTHYNSMKNLVLDKIEVTKDNLDKLGKDSPFLVTVALLIVLFDGANM